MKSEATFEGNENFPQLPLASVELSAAKWRTRSLSFLLVLVTFAAYLPVAGNSFINLDDGDYILGRPEIRNPSNWNLVRWAFTTYEQANWHPLTWISHAIDYRVFHSNPADVHLESVLWHALTAALLFLLLQDATANTWNSFLVGALYALHPLNVEAVAWGAERKTVLSMFFFALGLWAYGRYTRKRATAWYLAVVAAFAAGLMAKPQIVTFPFVLLLWDVWPLRRLKWKNAENHFMQLRTLVVEKVPLFVLSVASSIVTMVAQNSGGAVSSLAVYPLSLRLANAIVSYARYLEKALWPSNLALLYPYPANGMPAWHVVTAAALLLAISTFVLVARTRLYLLIGWLWFLGTLVPMIGLVQVGMAAMADRYAGLALIGLFLMVVWGVADLLPERATSGKWIAWGMSTVLLVLGVTTYRLAGSWRDSASIWSHALQVGEDSLVAEVNLGVALSNRDQSAEAIRHFQRALSYGARDPTANLYLGMYEIQSGHPRVAAQHLKTALTYAGKSSVPWKEIAYADLGTAYRQMEQYDQARENFQAALQINPGNLSAQIGMGLVAHYAGDWPEAIRWYSQIMKTQPNAVACLLLAKALDQTHELVESRRMRDEAMQLTSDLAASQIMVDRMLGHIE